MEKNYKKSWITRWILVSTKNKKKICNKFFQAKDPERIQSLHEIFKKYRNIIANLARTNKENYYKNYFQENKNNFCKTWQGIKQIIIMKKTNSKKLNGLKVNNIIDNDSKSIASEFN